MILDFPGRPKVIVNIFVRGRQENQRCNGNDDRSRGQRDTGL